MNPLDELANEIQSNESVVDGTVVLLDNLGEFMRTHANDPAAIRDMGNKLITQKQKLADAVARNTPADTSSGSGPTE